MTDTPAPIPVPNSRSRRAANPTATADTLQQSRQPQPADALVTETQLYPPSQPAPQTSPRPARVVAQSQPTGRPSSDATQPTPAESLSPADLTTPASSTGQADPTQADSAATSVTPASQAKSVPSLQPPAGDHQMATFTQDQAQPWTASVVIPAYNEAALINRCLAALTYQEGINPDTLQVVVVANGCTDDTAAKARSFAGLPGLTVIELDEGNKIGALNAGDAVCRAFPRIYLDADISLSTTAVRDLCQALDVTGPQLAVPRAAFDTSRSSWPVTAFWKTFDQLPYAQEGAAACVYAMNEAGRATFGDFPNVTADDLFVHERFDSHQRVTVPAVAHVLAPRDVRSLVAIRTRVARGNQELADANLRQGDSSEGTGASTAKALASLVGRSPQQLPNVAVYTAVTAVSRIKAARAMRANSTPASAWERDDSIRH